MLRNSLIVRFTAALLLLLLIPSTIFTYLAGRDIKEAERFNADQYLLSNLKTVSATVDSILKNSEFLHVALLTDQEFVSTLKRLSPYKTRKEYRDFLDTNIIKSAIAQPPRQSSYIESTYAYAFSANRFFASSVNWDPAFNDFETASSRWFQTYEARSGSQPWCITQDVARGKTILSSYRAIWEYGKDKPHALISLNISSGVISELLSRANATSRGFSFAQDAYGNTIPDGSIQPEESYRAVSDALKGGSGFLDLTLSGETRYISYYTSPYSALRFVAVAAAGDIEKALPILNRLTVWFIVDTVIVVLLFLAMAFLYFLRPIRALIRGMRQIERGNFDTRLPGSSTYEIGYINGRFNQMAENTKKLIEENYVNQLNLKDAKLKTIQNQLNEHFLYNTLDSIHWKARSRDSQEVCNMIYSLATFYRISLSSGKDEIEVEQVAEMLTNYLYIQRIRMFDELRYEISVDPEIAKRKVLKYLFQPLVENSVQHGLRQSKSGGELRVRFLKSGDFLRFEVTDNGSGITPERLAQIRAELDSGPAEAVSCFALRSVDTQLRIVYGAGCRLNIESEPGQGTRAWFDIPLSTLEVIA